MTKFYFILESGERGRGVKLVQRTSFQKGRDAQYQDFVRQGTV